MNQPAALCPAVWPPAGSGPPLHPAAPGSAGSPAGTSSAPVTHSPNVWSSGVYNFSQNIYYYVCIKLFFSTEDFFGYLASYAYPSSAQHCFQETFIIEW